MNLITGGTTLSRSRIALRIALLSLTLAAISGCSFSGLGGTTRLSCPVPDGSMCKSISQTYADAMKTSDGASSNNTAAEAAPRPPARVPLMPILPLDQGQTLNLMPMVALPQPSEAQPVISERSGTLAAVTTATTIDSTTTVSIPTLSPAATPPAVMVPATVISPPASSRSLHALPLRSAPRTMRVWIAPYEDADGDLNDQKFIYVQVDAGGWNVEHQRELATKRFAPLKAPAPTSSLTDKTDAAKALTAPAGQFK